eukprot:s1134_g10.t1
MHACRIGEAQNPGPADSTADDQSLISFAVTNPTAVHQKADDLALLKADCLILSETSATSLVQSTATPAFRAHGYKTLWGAVVPQQLKQGDPNSFRGAAIGVSFHSKLPMRPSRNALDTAWYDAGRFQHVFLRLPNIEIQICNLYGIPASVASAKARTNTLLQFAHQTVRQSTFPAMIVGDLNHHPDTLEEMAALRSDGFRSLEEIFRSKYGQELPPTFGDVTRNDVCLVHPIIAEMVHDIWIDQQHLVTGHNPLCFRLKVPTKEITRQCWRLPESWIRLQPQQALIDQHYVSIFDSLGTLPSGDTQIDEHPIQRWTQAVEAAVHEAIKSDHAVMTHDEIDTFPQEVQVMQPRETADPGEVADQLSIYWRQFWNRDTVESQSNLAQWEAFEQLRQQIPVGDLIQVDLTSVELLQKAIQQTSSATSRGCCGWSADELKNLPTSCIADLLQTFNRMLPDGFPTWMMQARVLPVAKSYKANQAKATRPITVLSLMYRVFSKWTSRQILQAWARSLPVAISGFLPGRSSHRLVYEMQLALEATNHGFSNSHWGGLTLDIVKAFNTLPHLPLCQLLCHLGIPNALVRAWISSIQRMVRHWQIDSQLFPVTEATTGLPEGDAWSVVGMLAVNVFMVTLMTPITRQLNAFADNWSYATTDPQHHQPAISTLKQIADALAIAIDWGKTWAWGTSSQHQEALQTAKNSILDPEVQLQLVTHARDLGYIMHYRLAPFRGTQKERHKQALARLHRLRKSDLPVQDKAYVAMASAVTKALYGTHMYLVGEEYFSQLRSKIASALLGDHHNIQSHLACSCLSPTLVDPELWVIQNAIKEARLFLLQAPSDLANLFLRMAANHRVRSHLIVGPAMALNAYLAKLGWSIDQGGALHGVHFNYLHLLQSNQEQLMLAAEKAWMDHVSLSVSNRHHLRNLPRIDNRATIQIFQTIPPDQQRTVGLDLCMGYMLNNQKAHFDDNQDAACQFCDMPDTVQHRVLHCEATQVVRTKFREVCAFLSDHDLIHTLLPAVYADPEVDFHTLIFEKYPEPQCSPLPYKPKFLFTDGSCKLPTDPAHRWASFAIVTTRFDLAQMPTERIHDTPWLLEHSFDVVAASHVTGAQTIPRAELLGATLAQEMELQVPVITDSMYVMYAHQLIEATPHVWKLAKKKNFDLLRRLHVLHWDKQLEIPVRKVKSHQKVMLQDPEAFFKLGNAVADLAATMTQDQLARSITTQLARLAEESKQMKNMLKDHLLLRSELAELRKRLETDEVQHDADAPRANFFKLYTVSNPQTFTFTTEQFEHVHASKFGSHYSALVLEWLQSLEWPRQPERQTPPVGVTWLELACNFMYTTQHSLMINVAPAGQPTRYACTEDDAAVVPLAEASVLIAVASEHRAEGFDACRYIIDTLKAKVPIWKKEIYADGETWKANKEWDPTHT